MPVDFSSLFTADHAAAQREHSQSVTFRAIGRSRQHPEFTVTSAIVGDLNVGEQGEIDGQLDSFSSSMIVLRSECLYKPQHGQKVQLASGRVVEIDQVMETTDGVTYPITFKADCNA